eukprot:jgi/Chlat1/8972/Chrsp94S08271
MQAMLARLVQGPGVRLVVSFPDLSYRSGVRCCSCQQQLKLAMDQAGDIIRPVRRGPQKQHLTDEQLARGDRLLPRQLVLQGTERRSHLAAAASSSIAVPACDEGESAGHTSNSSHAAADQQDRLYHAGEVAAASSNAVDAMGDDDTLGMMRLEQSALAASPGDVRIVEAISEPGTSHAGSSQQARPHNGNWDRPRHQRPDHFLSLRIRSDRVREVFQLVQSSLIDHDPALQRALVSCDSAHLTVLVLAIGGNDDALARAMDALASCQQALAATGLSTRRGEFQIQLSGLSSFRDEVLYLAVADGPDKERLHQLANCIRQHFMDNGLFDRHMNKNFTPHLTLAKLSKMQWAGRGSHRKRIPFEAYRSHAGIDAGVVTLSSLELCSMTAPKVDGYYKVISSIPLAMVS